MKRSTRKIIRTAINPRNMLGPKGGAARKKMAQHIRKFRQKGAGKMISERYKRGGFV